MKDSRSATRPLRGLTSAKWRDHFERNAAAALQFSNDWPPELTASERATVARSVQTFQLGESGQGRHILRVAGEHAEQCGDPAYLDAMRLFVREEQRHGEYLGLFLDREGIARINKHWSNRIFYRLRHLVGLEGTITILLTAELIAMVYYAALRKATRSVVLRLICTQFLADEVAHIQFQAERLAVIRRDRTRWRRALVRRVERIFLRATCAAVWRTHAKVFRAADIGRREFVRRTFRELNKARHIIDRCRKEHRCMPQTARIDLSRSRGSGLKTRKGGFLSRTN